MGIVKGKVVKILTPPRCVREGIWSVDTVVNVYGNKLEVPVIGCTKLEVMSKSKVGCCIEILEESMPVPRTLELKTVIYQIKKGDIKNNEPIKYEDSPYYRKELVDFFKENPPIPLKKEHEHS